MSIKVLSLLISGCFLFSASASASANLATSPVAVRQTYSDSSFTEMTCSLPETCTFTLGKNGHILSKHSFPAAPPDHDGPPTVIDPYYYWPAYKSDSWVLKFEIQCSDSDIARVDGANFSNSRCYAYLELREGKMIYQRIEIHSDDKATSYRLAPEA